MPVPQPPPPSLSSSATSLCPPIRISCCRFCRNRTVTSPPIAPSCVRKPLTRVPSETRLHHTTAALRLQIRGDHGERETYEKTDDSRRPHAEPFHRGAHRAENRPRGDAREPASDVESQRDAFSRHRRIRRDGDPPDRQCHSLEAPYDPPRTSRPGQEPDPAGSHGFPGRRG